MFNVSSGLKIFGFYPLLLKSLRGRSKITVWEQKISKNMFHSSEICLPTIKMYFNCISSGSLLLGLEILRFFGCYFA